MEKEWQCTFFVIAAARQSAVLSDDEEFESVSQVTGPVSAFIYSYSLDVHIVNTIRCMSFDMIFCMMTYYFRVAGFSLEPLHQIQAGAE